MSVVIGGSGLAPEVEVGTLGLDLAPHRETAKHNDDEDEQLLHAVSLPLTRQGPAQARAKDLPLVFRDLAPESGCPVAPLADVTTRLLTSAIRRV
jgi:hypothetical protein